MPEVELLTAREWEVLRLVGQGLTNEQIAAKLVISVWTVQQHLRSIFVKLGVASRIQAALKAKVLIYIDQEADQWGEEQWRAAPRLVARRPSQR